MCLSVLFPEDKWNEQNDLEMHSLCDWLDFGVAESWLLSVTYIIGDGKKIRY
jgi:hypothetical protein